MKNSCFRTSASSLLKRTLVRIQRQKLGYSALLRIKREDTSIKLKWDTFETQKNFEKIKTHSTEKKLKGDPLVSSGFVSYV